MDTAYQPTIRARRGRKSLADGDSEPTYIYEGLAVESTLGDF